MIILGVDPGFGRTGFGVIEVVGNKRNVLDVGCIETNKELSHEKRLLIIFQDISALIQRHQVKKVAIERLFFNKNVTTALQVGEARGMILLAAAQAQLSIYEATPSQVKSAITGNGSATKAQVQHMVQIVLQLKQKPRPDDAADALAIAYCCAQAAWQENL